MTKCIINPGRSIQAGKLYLPGEEIELEAEEAAKLEKRGLVTIVGADDQDDDTTARGKRPTAKEVITLALAAETIEALDALAEGEDRQTALDAIAKRREELTAE